MKKRILIILMTLLTLCISLAGCSQASYTPSSNETYYEIDGVYRVINLKNNEPQEEKAYPLHSYMLETGAFGVINVPVDRILTKNDLLFYNFDDINKKGVEQIYKLIGVKNTSRLTNDMNKTFIVNLGTFNEWDTDFPCEYKIPFDTSKYEKKSVVGLLADVKVYTITYEDRSKTDGTKVAEGEYQVILIDGAPWIDIFVI